MSQDWTVRSPQPLGLDQVVTGLAAAGGHLGMRTNPAGDWVVVVDEHDEPRLWLSPSRRVASDSFVTDVCAPGEASIAPWSTPHGLASAVAAALARAAGESAQAVRESASTVPDDPGNRPIPDGPTERRSDREDCPLDRITAEAGVLIQSRPELGLTPWLVNAGRWAVEHDLTLVVLTPAATNLSPAAAQFLTDTRSGWVVDDRGRHRDGLSGIEVRWDGVNFRPGDQIQDRVRASSPVLVIQAETTHAYTASARIGDFTRAVLDAFGAGPMKAGPYEPAGRAFEPDWVTDLVKGNSPGPTRLALSSDSGRGVLGVTPQPIGLVEHASLVVTRDEEAPDVSALRAMAESLLAQGAQIVTVAAETRADSLGHSGSGVPERTLLMAAMARARFGTLGEARLHDLIGGVGEIIHDPVPAVLLMPDGGEDFGRRAAIVLAALAANDDHELARAAEVP